MLWDRAPRTLIPTRLSLWCPGKPDIQYNAPINNELATAAKKLRKKVGDIKVPITKALSTVRRTAISRAALKPRVAKATSVSMFARPSRSPGMG
jgi:hypothetical protein